jgi:enterochelin esterase-like enzyme
VKTHPNYLKLIGTIAIIFITSSLFYACSPAPINNQAPSLRTPVSNTIVTAIKTSSTPTNAITNTPSPTPTRTPSPTLTQTPSPPPNIPGCKEQIGRIERGSLTTNQLEEPLDYYVYLPPCYNEQPNKKYPVLYLIHGLGFTNDQWIRLGAAEKSDELITKGKIPPLIIVFPHDRLQLWPNHDNFGKVLVNELVPSIDQNYRTIPDRDMRSIGGLSRGASWAVHLGLKYWKLFGSIGGHSLPIFLKDPDNIQNWLKEIPPRQYPHFYLDIGDRDPQQIMTAALWFEKLLTEENVPHEWYLNIGTHEESYWSKHVEEYLLWYTAEW